MAKQNSDVDNIPLEKDIQREVCDWLATRNAFFWRSNNVPVFGRSNDGVKRFRALPKYTPRGLPDIIIIHKGKFIGIEVKRPKMALRKEQKEFKLGCILAEGYYAVVHSLEEAKQLLPFI